VIPSAEIVEHKIVVRDDVRRAQHSVVSREVGIACERDVIPQTGRTSASGVHAVLSHASRDDEVGDPSFLEFLLQRGLKEGIRFPFPDDGLAARWLY
jgi:hypothetical protein